MQKCRDADQACFDVKAPVCRGFGSVICPTVEAGLTLFQQGSDQAGFMKKPRRRRRKTEDGAEEENEQC